jgi:ribosome biogenesis GTPase
VVAPAAGSALDPHDQEDDAMDLADLGWDDGFARDFDACTEPGTVPARIARADGSSYRVFAGGTHDAGECLAVLAGRLTANDEAPVPVVGDWCALLPSVQGGPAVVRAVLPRRTVFARKSSGRNSGGQALAANVDVAFLVTGLDADFSLRRIERLLALAWESGARPVVLLNKSDVCDEVPARLAQTAGVAPGVTTIALSAARGEGIDEVRSFIPPGRTVVFLGSSGVGKSTLVNRLLGTEKMKTNETRARDGRGMHTTTHRELMMLPAGGVLVDTPGLREVGMWAGEEALEATFEDIVELAAGCRFTDCAHDTEPGCAVRAAVESGELDAARLASYHALQREAASAARRADEHLRRQYERRTMGKWRKQIKDKRRMEGF